MRETVVEYEQFCMHKNQNVWLEEHRKPNGEVQILCRQSGACESRECRCIRQLLKSLEISKTFQK